MNAHAGDERGGVTGQPGVSATSSAGFSIVVAMDRKRGIGNKGDLPWPKLKGDMRFFRELTTCPARAAVEKRWGLKVEESADVQAWEDVSAMLKFAHPLLSAREGYDNTVIMGRKTWQSLPQEFQPLPMRANLVLSRNPEYRTFRGQAHGWPSLRSAIQGAKTTEPSIEMYVIGGGETYLSALTEPDCIHLYITEIDAEFECDTYFPETPNFKPVLSSPWIDEGGVRYRFRRYDRI